MRCEDRGRDQGGASSAKDARDCWQTPSSSGRGLERVLPPSLRGNQPHHQHPDLRLPPSTTAGQFISVLEDPRVVMLCWGSPGNESHLSSTLGHQLCQRSLLALGGQSGAGAGDSFRRAGWAAPARGGVASLCSVCPQSSAPSLSGSSHTHLRTASQSTHCLTATRTPPHLDVPSKESAVPLLPSKVTLPLRTTRSLPFVCLDDVCVLTGTFGPNQ